MTGATSPLEIPGAPLHVSEANDDPAWLRNVKRDVNRFGPFHSRAIAAAWMHLAAAKTLARPQGKRGSFEE